MEKRVVTSRGYMLLSYHFLLIFKIFPRFHLSKFDVSAVTYSTYD